MEPLCGIIKDVAVGLTTGLAASAMYEWLVASRKSRALKNEFAPLAGRYAEYVRDPGSKLAETGGIITLMYDGQTKFLVEATPLAGEREWHGELFMREEAGLLARVSIRMTDKITRAFTE
jgi:hypothetical protein